MSSHPPPHEHEPWTSRAAKSLNLAESAVLVAIGGVLVVLALLLLGTSVMSMVHSVQEDSIGKEAIEILNSVLLVMMTMEIVYTVAVSLQSHTLVAEPFLIIGAIAAIRRMLVITATSTDHENNPSLFFNTLVELGLLTASVVALALAIWILRRSARDMPQPPAPPSH